MRNLVIYTAVIATGEVHEYTGKEIFKDFTYAYDMENNEYFCTISREELDKIKPEDIIHTTELVQELEIDTEGGLDELLETFNLMPVDHLRSVYLREQHYGGGEEGGWYYHTETCTSYDPNDPDIKERLEEGTDRYGEGLTLTEELIRGENERTGSQHYC